MSITAESFADTWSRQMRRKGKAAYKSCEALMDGGSSTANHEHMVSVRLMPPLTYWSIAYTTTVTDWNLLLETPGGLIFPLQIPNLCLPQHSWTPNDDMSHKVNLLAFLHPSCSMHYGEQRAYQEATTASTCRLCLSQWRRGCTNNACIGPWISRHHQSAWSSRLQRWRGKRQAGGHPIPVNSNATSTIEKRCCRTDIGQPYRRPWMLARSFITPFCSTASTIAPHYTHQPKPTLLLPLNNALNCCHHFTHIHGAIRKVDSSVTIISMSRQNSHLASFRRAVRRKSLISWICFGCNGTQWKAAEIAHQANLLEPQFSTSERRVRGTHHGVCYTDFLL